MTQPADNRELGFDPREFDTNPVENAYRDALGDGLERVLDRGADTLAEIVQGLNAMSVSTRDGTPWTEATLAAELDRLGR
jgi:Recombinase-like helix-turn-helix domain